MSVYDIAAQVDAVLAAVADKGPAPHIAERIEPGAILYSSWGYDQTNVDYYLVTRTTWASCWIVPMSHVECPSAGYSPMSGHTTPLEAITSDRWGEPIVPKMHRIRRYGYGERTEEAVTLTSYSSARLWDGWALYASHYA